MNACDKCTKPIPDDGGAFCDPCADAVWDRFYDRHEDGDWE